MNNLTNSNLVVFTIKEVAEVLKCRERTVKGHLYVTRDLRYLKIGREVRILQKDLVEFLNSRLMPCVTDQEILECQN
ncbi:MAG: helix-turn-helix domain-containing protein [SAR324 cluster bacterium]|nr:helix-turn-helix domain-containing protein [SAR324 cluster bacterium]